MFGMGFTEILIISVIAILFLGPDKLPSAMIEIAKFFRNAKKTIGSVKDSLEEEMNVKDIKEEALAYKKELMDASHKLESATDTSTIGEKIASIGDDILDEGQKQQPQESVKAEKVTFEKKKKKKKIEEDSDV
jgi:sec-independent protein translocase protein TatB